MSEFSCKNCGYFQSQKTGLGLCKRNAPTPMAFTYAAVWPVVRESDGCGEMRLAFSWEKAGKAK